MLPFCVVFETGAGSLPHAAKAKDWPQPTVHSSCLCLGMLTETHFAESGKPYTELSSLISHVGCRRACLLQCAERIMHAGHVHQRFLRFSIRCCKLMQGQWT